MINIALLGSGGSMPMPGRFLSSLLMSYKGRKILIDCGEGTQVSMKNMNSGFKSIDMICITHIHGDHIFGLPGLLSTIGNSARTEPITIIGPEGIKDIMNSILTLIPYLPYTINVIENPPPILGISFSTNGLKVEEHSNEDIQMSILELDHSCSCLGYSFYIVRRPKFCVQKAISNQVPKEIWSRLQNGEFIVYGNRIYEPDMVLGEKRKGIKLSYITDTRPINTIPDFINGSDLLICEGTYGDNEDIEKAIKNKHMTFAEAAGLAYKGNVKELLLTHFSPSINEPILYKMNAIEIFQNTTIGYDGFTKELCF
ncbi:MAG: ribonuclease Z [Sporanaerobacter sp.]|jgi:ribonuclease Z|uniref:ribonuclease Z n=1 Tax=Sporanaerobacter sp. TaxID=2010183 RepID=UPI003A0FC1FC